MKEYKKFMKVLYKDDRFMIKDSNRRNTVKVIHKVSGIMYSVHPADQAIKPLKSWIRKVIKTKK